MRIKAFFSVTITLFMPLILWAQSNPESEINVPIRLAISPLYNWVERSVDIVFTSEGYPDGWVEKGCDLRYRYKFWRGPMRMKASGQTLDLGFTGNYQIEGSSRVCVKGVVISPWTPPCRCGYSEGARKVEVRFLNTLSVLPKYQVQLKIQPQRPTPADPCKVCFWDQDITQDVMNGLWDELVLAKQSMEKQYGILDLRPYLISTWTNMNRPIALGQYGWLMIRPLGFRLNRLAAVGDSIDISVGLRARPVVVNTVPMAYMTAVPTDWDKPSTTDDFNLNVSLDLRYDSLSRVLNRTFLPISIKPEKGPFRKKVNIDSLTLTNGEGNRIQFKLHISGKYAGELILSGEPIWDSASGNMRLAKIEYDLKTRHRILGKAAQWFDSPIRKWLEEKCWFDLAGTLDEKRSWIEKTLNQAQTGPLKCSGKLDRLDWLSLENRSELLHIQIGLRGKMECRADLSKFSL
ncbi:MAG: DUF4403 family protein [Bacteroidota bacterium]